MTAGESAADQLTPEQKKEVITASAAAALDTIVEGEQKDAKSRGKK